LLFSPAFELGKDEQINGTQVINHKLKDEKRH